VLLLPSFVLPAAQNWEPGPEIRRAGTAASSMTHHDGPSGTAAFIQYV
jgi:hypothetical protein